MKICLLLLWPIWALQAEQPVFIEQNIFPLQGKHVHASSIIQCPNGDLLACWFHGSGERTANDVQVQGARLRHGQKAWSPVFLMADTPGFPDCNPVLFVDGRRRLWLIWVTVLDNQWHRSLLKYRLSSDFQNDGPPHWQWQDVLLMKPGNEFAVVADSAFAALNQEEPQWAEYAPTYEKMLREASRDSFKRLLGWMSRTHPLTLPNGRILLPLYSDGFNFGLIAISDDDGEHWRPSAPIVGFGSSQPTLVLRQDGSLIAYLRDDGDPPKRVQFSTSVDQGLSWSAARDTDIPNPGSSLEVLRLKNGCWLMIYNDTEEGRHSLTAGLSDDEGKSWKWRRPIARSAANEKSYAYPSVIQSADGLIQVTFSYAAGTEETIRHVIFNEAWVRAAP